MYLSDDEENYETYHSSDNELIPKNRERRYLCIRCNQKEFVKHCWQCNKYPHDRSCPYNINNPRNRKKIKYQPGGFCRHCQHYDYGGCKEKVKFTMNSMKLFKKLLQSYNKVNNFEPYLQLISHPKPISPKTVADHIKSTKYKSKRYSRFLLTDIITKMINGEDYPINVEEFNKTYEDFVNFIVANKYNDITRSTVGLLYVLFKHHNIKFYYVETPSIKKTIRLYRGLFKLFLEPNYDNSNDPDYPLIDRLKLIRKLNDEPD